MGLCGDRCGSEAARISPLFPHWFAWEARMRSVKAFLVFLFEDTLFPDSDNPRFLPRVHTK